MPDRKLIPGKFVWFEHISKDAGKAQAFYRDVLGWKVLPFPMGSFTYDMILAGETPDTMIGGYAPPRNGQRSHWIAYVSVDDVDATVKAATANGGKVIEAPQDTPEAGRMARIADPQGAEISLIKRVNGDPADGPVPSGRFLWNELHTNDAAKALAFYEKVLGFSHRAMDMGGGTTYHIVSRAGVDRGGAIGDLPAGVKPYWLPYVSVDDVDATVARAKKAGATIRFGPDDIPGVGRFGTLEDPTGAAFAVIKPMPREI